MKLAQNSPEKVSVNVNIFIYIIYSYYSYFIYIIFIFLSNYNININIIIKMSLQELLNSLSTKTIKNIIRAHNLHTVIRLGQKREDLIKGVITHYDLHNAREIRSKIHNLQLPEEDVKKFLEKPPKRKTNITRKTVKPVQPVELVIEEQKPNKDEEAEKAEKSKRTLTGINMLNDIRQRKKISDDAKKDLDIRRKAKQKRDEDKTNNKNKILEHIDELKNTIKDLKIKESNVDKQYKETFAEFNNKYKKTNKPLSQKTLDKRYEERNEHPPIKALYNELQDIRSKINYTNQKKINEFKELKQIELRPAINKLEKIVENDLQNPKLQEDIQIAYKKLQERRDTVFTNFMNSTKRKPSKDTIQDYRYKINRDPEVDELTTLYNRAVSLRRGNERKLELLMKEYISYGEDNKTRNMEFYYK